MGGSDASRDTLGAAARVLEFLALVTLWGRVLGSGFKGPLGHLYRDVLFLRSSKRPKVVSERG